MCRNIRPLFNFEPPAYPDEVHAASLQYVRKVSGMNKPSLANQAAFDSGVTGTPTIEVNGEKIPDGALANEQALREALTNPAK